MRTLFFILVLLLVSSCSKKKPIEQVDFDLRNMLENKAEVKELNIKQIVSFSENRQEYDSIYFDCKLHFTDDLFSDDFKFDKGMRISAKNNVFIYDKSNRLIKLKFGEASLIRK